MIQDILRHVGSRRESTAVVSRDSILTPADPLLVINAINRGDGVQPPSHFDVTGDTVVDAADVDFVLRVS